MSYGMTLLKMIVTSPQFDLRAVSVVTHPGLNKSAVEVLLKDWEKLGWIYNDPSAHVSSETKGESHD
jgi:DNA-binding IclR family transcriptional regulator